MWKDCKAEYQMSFEFTNLQETRHHSRVCVNYPNPKELVISTDKRSNLLDLERTASLKRAENQMRKSSTRKLNELVAI